jgi:hypothetical protein
MESSMSLIKIVILLFIVLESSNVLALYFAPESKLANSVGIFTAWEESKQYPEVHDFVKYLVNWVAGVKLILLLLLAAIIIFADPNTQRMSLIALSIGTLSFYWRLFPLIRKMDQNGKIDPKNYSTALAVMIFMFVGAFIVALIL